MLWYHIKLTKKILRNFILNVKVEINLIIRFRGNSKGTCLKGHPDPTYSYKNIEKKYICDKMLIIIMMTSNYTANSVIL